MSTYVPPVVPEHASTLDAPGSAPGELRHGSRLDSSRSSWAEFVVIDVDPHQELAAAVASLESMRLDPTIPEISSATLVSLHSALFLFQLGGRRELLPAAGALPFGRRFTERRLLSDARRLAASNDSYANWLAAGDLIDALIGVVDPDLSASVRSVA
jgi:hypothetical protein